MKRFAWLFFLIALTPPVGAQDLSSWQVRTDRRLPLGAGREFSVLTKQHDVIASISCDPTNGLMMLVGFGVPTLPDKEIQPGAYRLDLDPIVRVTWVASRSFGALVDKPARDLVEAMFKGRMLYVGIGEVARSIEVTTLAPLEPAIREACDLN